MTLCRHPSLRFVKVALLALLKLAGPSEVWPEQIVPAEAEFKIRTGRAPFPSVDDLIDRPTKIETNLSSWRVGGNHIIRSETDYHAVFPVTIEKVLSVLLDYEGTREVYGFVRESVVIEASPMPFDLHVVRLAVGFSVLGFGEKYVYVTNNWIEEDDRGGYTQTYTLAESVDDKLYAILGNWYIEPIVYEGAPYTYVRQYAIIGVQRGSRSIELAMRVFGGRSLRQNFRQLSAKTKGS